jgi:uncharacterized protein YyaL (SSP411 family)
MDQAKRPKPRRHTYSVLDVMRASTTQPVRIEDRERQVNAMRSALTAIAAGSQPSPDDWRLCSDAVNMMETVVEQGLASDGSGLLADAITALALAGKRHMQGQPIRLDGPGLVAVRAVIEDYAEVMAAIPARAALHLHRLTERRLWDILDGKRRPHDVELISV